MPISISWLTKAQNAYIGSKHMKDSYPDSDEEPFRGKYEAREKLTALCDEALDLANEVHVDYYSPARLLCILFNHDIGVIDQETDELDSAVEHLAKAKALCDEWFPDDPRLILLRISILNQLAFVHSMKPDFIKGLSLLHQANSEYEQWKEWTKTITAEGARGRAPRTMIEIMECFASKIDDKLQKPEAENEVEKVHTTTLYYLAQVYEKLGDSDRSAHFCYRTLKKQIALNFFKTMEWCLNVATLAQYFAGINRFAVASHLLRASCYMMDHRPEVKDAKLAPDDDEEVLKGTADYHRIMVKYYLMLLEYSSSEGEDKLEEEASKIDEFRFIHEEELERKNVDPIRYQLIASFDEASPVFQAAKKDCELAREYYTLDEHASDHVSCIQDLSKLYRLTAVFTSDLDVKSKLYKRRVDLLEGLLKEINPKLFLDQCRQIYFELGETYYEMYEFKLSPDPIHTSSKIRKMNVLLVKSGDYYRSFIDTFLAETQSTAESTESGRPKRPTRVPDDMVKPLIVSYFNVGRTISRLFPVDGKEKIVQWDQCLSTYEVALDYINSNPDQKELVQEEMKLIHEMKTLIPQRMAQMSGSNLIA